MPENAPQVATARTRIAQPAAGRDFLGQTAEEVLITRKSLPRPPDPQGPRTSGPEAADLPAYRRNGPPAAHSGARRGRRAAAGAAGVRGDGRGDRAGGTNTTRLELKRLAGRGIPIETEQGLFTQPRP
jgi:hypothetical protein